MQNFSAPADEGRQGLRVGTCWVCLPRAAVVIPKATPVLLKAPPLTYISNTMLKFIIQTYF